MEYIYIYTCMSRKRCVIIFVEDGSVDVFSKTVLTRIISIVRVPSLCIYKDTHRNYDDEL